MKCESCGKHYDYNKSESCPWCGAYNIPKNRDTHTCSTREFEEGKLHQGISSTAEHTHQSHQPSPGEDRAPFSNHGNSPTTAGGESTRYKKEQGSVEKSGSSKKLLVIGLIVVAILLLNVGVPIYTSFSHKSASNYAPEPSASPVFPTPAPQEPEFYTHNVEEPFNISGYELVVHSMKNVPLKTLYPAADEGSATCLVVDVSATLKDPSALDSVLPPFPFLYYNDYFDYVLPVDPDYFPEVFTAYNCQPLNFVDMKRGETEEGAFVFILYDEEITSLIFGFDEYMNSGDNDMVSSHEIPFPVSTVLPNNL